MSLCGVPITDRMWIRFCCCSWHPAPFMLLSIPLPHPLCVAYLHCT
jgi:hypothetical protein